jgi:hypothetical protein
MSKVSKLLTDSSSVALVEWSRSRENSSNTGGQLHSIDAQLLSNYLVIISRKTKIGTIKPDYHPRQSSLDEAE